MRNAAAESAASNKLADLDGKLIRYERPSGRSPTASAVNPGCDYRLERLLETLEKQHRPSDQDPSQFATPL